MRADCEGPVFDVIFVHLFGRHFEGLFCDAHQDVLQILTLIFSKLLAYWYDQIAGLIYELQQAGVLEIYVAEILTRGDFSKCPDPEMNKT